MSNSYLKNNKHHHEIYNVIGKLCHNCRRAWFQALTKKIELIDFIRKRE